MFTGHQLYKIDNDWVFNLTEFKGYKVKIDKSTGKVVGYQLAYILEGSTGFYSFHKEIEVPLSILRKTVEIVDNYTKEALLTDEYS